jgi:Domain of unknown function (DUF4178)
MTVTALVCPKCGAPVRVTAAGRSLSVVCGGCGSTLDAATPELRLLQEGAAALAIPEIALGSRAVLAGIEWEVVAYLERSSAGDSWREYLLFNPWEGYAWLVDADGFALGRAILAEPETIERTARLEGVVWQGQRRYEAEVTLALGEFPWRVAVGERVSVAEYRRGSSTLCLERGAQGTSWTMLEPLPVATISAAFGIAERRAPPEPTPPLASLWPHKLAVAMVAFILMWMIDAQFRPTNVLPAADIEVPINGSDISTSIPIELPPGRHYVVISADPRGAGLDNEWLDLDYTLVDRKTQASYPVSAVAEYYRGVDGEGPWTEGDEHPRTSLSAIPGGSFDLIIEAQGNRWQAPGSLLSAPEQSWLPDLTPPPVRTISISLTAGGTDGNAFFWATLLLFTWPLGLLWWRLETKDQQQRDDW